MTRCPAMSTTGTGCDKCGAPLKGRRTRWCTNRCSLWYVNNHRYTQARTAAKRKARTRPHTYQCAHCKGLTTAPEVNHIIPCIGKHDTIGCHHHQENLEVLCHPCHLEATAKQRAGGMFPTRSRAKRTVELPAPAGQ